MPRKKGSVAIRFLSKEEKRYYQKIKGKYNKQYHLDNPADEAILSSIITNQVLLFRYNKFLIEGVDYEGNKINLKEIQQQALSVQEELRRQMEVLGISRNRRLGEGRSAKEIIEDILKRAREFMVHKNEVAMKFLEAYYEIKHLINTHYRLNSRERERFKLRESDVIYKIKVILDELEKIEDEFRKNQKLWMSEVRGD